MTIKWSNIVIFVLAILMIWLISTVGKELAQSVSRYAEVLVDHAEDERNFALLLLAVPTAAVTSLILFLIHSKNN